MGKINTHANSDGSSHSYIDQDVTSGSTPTFTGTNFTGIDHGTGLLGLADDDHTQYSLISSQAGAPSSTPSRVGEINIDTTNDDVYISKGTASSSDWVLMTHLITYAPTGIEFGNTDQEYDVDGTTWVNAVAGGTLGGIPDETSTGHKLADCLSAIDTARDSSYLAVREDTGAASATNPLTVHFLFTSVAAFNTIDVKFLYNGSAAHTMGIELWNYTTSAYERVIEFSDQTFSEDFSFLVHGSSNFVGTGGDAGKVKLQFIHDDAGNSAHNIQYDYVTIAKR
jgi:hypothetical protein